MLCLLHVFCCMYLFNLFIHNVLLVGGSKKRKGRGHLKGLAAATKRAKSGSQKLQIAFSSKRGGPIGPNHRTFVDEVVMFTRRKAPLIGVKKWKDINQDVKKSIANDILVRTIVLLSKHACYISNYKRVYLPFVFSFGTE